VIFDFRKKVYPEAFTGPFRINSTKSSTLVNVPIRQPPWSYTIVARSARTEKQPPNHAVRKKCDLSDHSD